MAKKSILRLAGGVPISVGGSERWPDCAQPFQKYCTLDRLQHGGAQSKETS